MSPEGGGFVIEPAFLAGPRCRLFSVHVSPAGERCRGAVLFVPALADEQNKARHVVSAVARRLAARGIGVLLMDLSGTGDSEREFAEIGWPDWVDDLETGFAWLRSHTDAPPVLWAMRGGAMLATLLAVRTGAQLRGLVLWNPVLRGAQVASELSRLRSASALLAAGATSEEREGTLSADPESLEVGGYCWSGDLVAGLKPVDVVKALPADLPVCWLDVARDPGRGLAPAVRKAIDALRMTGAEVEHLAVPGVAFWNSAELEWPAPLLDATVERIERLFA